MMKLALMAVVLAVGLACAEQPAGPTSPSPAPQPSAAPPAESVSIVAQVLEYGSERPIAHASVFLDSTAVGRTGEDGTLTTEAERGREVTMYATADGYERSLTVAGTPYAAERWTFYLEPAAN